MTFSLFRPGDVLKQCRLGKAGNGLGTKLYRDPEILGVGPTGNRSEKTEHENAPFSC